MTEQDIRSIALFFFFALLDEERATVSATKTIALVRERKKRRPREETPVLIVTATDEILEKERRENPVDWTVENIRLTSGAGWVLPSGLEMRSWKDFVQAAAVEESNAVVWSSILGYPDETIARGLRLPEGTVRYRLGRAFSKLGEFVGPRAAAVQ